MAEIEMKYRRAMGFMQIMKDALPKALEVGGVNAKMHVGDVLNLIKEFESGNMDRLMEQESAKRAPAPRSSSPGSETTP